MTDPAGKIHPSHTRRAAVVYVRQSSPGQVERYTDYPSRTSTLWSSRRALPLAHELFGTESPIQITGPLHTYESLVGLPRDGHLAEMPAADTQHVDQ